MQAVVVADDVTGVADCAAALWPDARTVGLVHDFSCPPAIDLREVERAGAVALDLELRSLAPDATSFRLRPSLAGLGTLLARKRELLVYLKIDSALRGHVGLTVRTAAEVLGVPAIPVVPANPSAVRTTLDGRQYAGGRPLHETDFARDPGHPIRTSSVVELLASAGLDTATGTAAELERWVGSSGTGATAGRAFVPDAATDDDLRRIGEVLVAGGVRVVCGSAGLVRHLAIKGAATDRASSDMDDAAIPTLVVVGSAHSMARRQLKRFEEALGVRAVVVTSPHAQGLGRAVEQLRDQGCAILAGPEPGGPTRGAHATARALGVAVRTIDRACRVEGAIVVGGETAWNVFHQLGIGAFRTVGRVESGMPIVLSSEEAPRRIALKPGSLGSPETLVNAARELRPPRVAARRMEEG